MSGFRRDPSEPPFVPLGGPNVSPPPKDVYARMGEDGIRRMIADLYLELEASEIRGMFPENLSASAEKSADFFVFLLGGPPVYQQKHGPPMMRKRHMPFRITPETRGVWLACFRKVLENAETAYGFPVERLAEFDAFLEGFSAWMVNSK